MLYNCTHMARVSVKLLNRVFVIQSYHAVVPQYKERAPYIRYDTIEEINVDSKAEYTA